MSLSQKAALAKTAALMGALMIAATPVLADTNPLAGAWTLVAADIVKPDGTRAHDYGDAPDGLLLITGDGHYEVQIYDTSRPHFAAGDKAKGTAAEYTAAVMGASIHYGTLDVDPVAHTMTLHMVRSSYPNQEGTQQVRIYELDGDMLSYRIPPRPDGSVPISVWRRVSQ